MDPKVARLDRLARAVSNVFHPLVIVIPTMLLAMVATGSDWFEAVLWTLLAVGMVNIPMLGLILWGMRSGHYSDASVSIREQRTSIYILGGLSLVLLLIILLVSRAPQVLSACLVSAVLATTIGYVINRKTKLSLHAAAMAGCATTLILTAFPFGVALALCAPMVAWARIRLKQHTPAQILLGWMVSMLSVIGTFALMT